MRMSRLQMWRIASGWSVSRERLCSGLHQPERAALGIATDGNLLALVDDAATKLSHLLKTAPHIRNFEVGQRHAVSWAGAASVESQLRAAAGMRLPALAFRSGTVLQRQLEHAVPEAAGTLDVIRRKFNQCNRGRHARHHSRSRSFEPVKVGAQTGPLASRSTPGLGRATKFPQRTRAAHPVDCPPTPRTEGSQLRDVSATCGTLDAVGASRATWQSTAASDVARVALVGSLRPDWSGDLDGDSPARLPTLLTVALGVGLTERLHPVRRSAACGLRCRRRVARPHPAHRTPAHRTQAGECAGQTGTITWAPPAVAMGLVIAAFALQGSFTAAQ